MSDDQPQSAYPEDTDEPDLTPEENHAAFIRDTAVQQLKIQQANLSVIKMALNDNRPLEALYTANNALDDVDDAIEVLEK